MCSVCFHHGKSAALPCLCHAGPRLQTTPWCLRRAWTLRSLTCPIMLAVTGRRTVARSFSCVRVVFVMLPLSFIQVSDLFDHRGSSCSGGTKDVCMHVLLNKDGVYTLVVYKIYFMQGLIFTYFI